MDFLGRRVVEVVEREAEGANLREAGIDARVELGARIRALRMRAVQARVERLAG